MEQKARTKEEDENKDEKEAEVSNAVSAVFQGRTTLVLELKEPIMHSGAGSRHFLFTSLFVPFASHVLCVH